MNKIKKYIQIGCSCLCLVTVLFSTALLAENNEEKKSNSILLDWGEFRRILKLDSDEIKLSWDEYRRLLAQIGFKVKDEYRIEGGDVILSKKQFKTLLEQMQPPKKSELLPPGDYLITKAVYNGVVDKKSTQFEARLDLKIFKKQKNTYSKIPLFREELAIEDVRINQNPASIITQGGWHYLSTEKSGKHLIKVKFSVKSSMDKGTPGLSFNIPTTPITTVALDIPKTNIEVAIANAQELETEQLNKHTIVKGCLLPSSRISISWKKKLTEKSRGPAKIYAELFNLLSIEADAIRVTTQVKLNIVQNKIIGITLAVPSGYQILEVTGQGKNMWSVREEKGEQFLEVPFEYPAEGQQHLTIKAEKILPEETMVADFTGFKVLKAKREFGFIAGEIKSDAEAKVQDFEGLDRIDFGKIPAELSGLSARPLLFAFKYVRHPYNVVVDITKYEKEEALNIIIDNVKGTTLFKEEGKQVHLLTFSVRNLWNQFLKLDLPQDAGIWSVYVDGKREKASKDGAGKILIPLVRSQRKNENSGLRPFKVELIYTQPAGKFFILGKKKSVFPSPDVLISTLEWDFYLPVNYKYLHFGGNLEREKVAKLHKPLWRRVTGGLTGGLADSSVSPLSITKQAVREETRVDESHKYGEKSKDEKVLRQRELKESVCSDKISGTLGRIEKEEEAGEFYGDDFSGSKGIKEFPAPALVGMEGKKDISLGLAGLLSVRMNIPISGKNYLFSKKIVEQGELLHLNFFYVNEWIINSILIILGLIILYFLFKMKRIFLMPVRALGKAVSKLFPLAKKCFQPKILPVVILVIFVLTKFLDKLFYLYNYFPILPAVLILLFIISLVRLFKNQIIESIKFLCRPGISVLIISAWIFFLLVTRLFIPFFPLLVLLFIGLIVSVIRVVVRFLKKRKERKEVKEEEANKEIK
ncbi:hypothetical protein KAU39_03140 [bacterium]|nr:hypothetical protein [bacterium]